MIEFKRLLITAFAACILQMTAYSVFAQKDPVSELADGVYSYAPGDGYASMFIVTTEGVVAIEPVSVVHAQGMVDAIKSITDQPIRYLLHSHNHWDHSKGGQVFRDQGAKILAHREAYAWMSANPHPDMALPDEGWEGKTKMLKLGETTIEMHYVGMSHGLGMTVFRLTDAKIAYIADIVTPNRVLFMIVPDFNINQWKRALTEVEALDFDQALYSHQGNAGYIGSKDNVTATREYIEDLQAAIVAEFQKGTPFAKVPDAVRLPKYEGWAMYDQWLHLNVMRVMLDMHMGPFPWREAQDFEQ